MYPYDDDDEDRDYVEHKLLVAMNRSHDPDEQLELSIELSQYRQMYKH